MSGQREPTATARAMARNIRDWYDALVNEGFTGEQAERLIGQILIASLGTQPPEED
jgi:hypothetical protein